MTQIPKASDFSPNAYEKRGETVLFVDVAAGQFNFACTSCMESSELGYISDTDNRTCPK